MLGHATDAEDAPLWYPLARQIHHQLPCTLMTILEQLAHQRTQAVISTAVSVAIEKMAEEAAREILQDPTFRAELKAAARQSFGRAIRELRRPRKATPRSRAR